MNRRDAVRLALAGGLAVATGAAAPLGKVNAASLVRPGDPIYGNPHGQVTIIDFYDIRCPPCRAMNKRIHKLLETDHDIRYVPVEYPILGPAGMLATKALYAARMQGAYRRMRALLMAQKPMPTMALMQEDAQQLGLDWPKMQAAMAGKAVAAEIAVNLARGRALGIHEIPAMYIGPVRVVGGLTSEDLRSVVRQAIGEQKGA